MRKFLRLGNPAYAGIFQGIITIYNIVYSRNYVQYNGCSFFGKNCHSKCFESEKDVPNLFKNTESIDGFRCFFRFTKTAFF